MFRLKTDPDAACVRSQGGGEGGIMSGQGEEERVASFQGDVGVVSHGERRVVM